MIRKIFEELVLSKETMREKTTTSSDFFVPTGVFF